MITQSILKEIKAPIRPITSLQRGILFDVDGVLLDWVYSFHEFMRDVYHLMPIDPTKYSIAERYGIPEKLALTLIQAFAYTPRAAQLCAYSDRDIRSVNRLVKEFGFKIGVLSCFSADRSEIRYANLQDVYSLNFRKDGYSKILDYGEDKEKHLNWLYHNRTELEYYVEDLPEFANTAAEIGFTTFLINRPWNSKAILHERVMRMDSVADICQEIQQ
jgi:hypothetical protein